MQHSVRPSFQVMLGVVLAVCLAAGAIALNWVVRKVFRKAWPPRWLAVSVRVGILAIAVAGVLGLAYGFFVEPYWLAVEHVRLNSHKLPPGTRPIRIVHISDFHSEGEVRCEEDVAEAVASELPDLVVYTGDAVNGPEGVAVFNECLRRMTVLAPTLAIRGGDDGWYASKHGLFARTGVIDVTGKTETLEIAGVEVCIGGINGRGKAPRALLAAPRQVLKILLCHYPSRGAGAVAGSGIDLCLAGNTHGGQVRLPLYGSAVGSKADRKYLAGLFRVDETWLYVNRGLGMSKASFAVRFGSRPEVTVIELSPPK